MAKIRNTAIPNNYGDGYKQEVTMDDNTTYKIENTPIPNNYGGGYQKEITSSNGKKYRIRNTAIPNNYGDGYKQEIYEVNKSKNSSLRNKDSILPIIIFILMIGPWLCIPFTDFGGHGLIVIFGSFALAIILGIIYELRY